MTAAPPEGFFAVEYLAFDTREKYAFRFSRRDVAIEHTVVEAGDYGVRDGNRWLAVVERKSMEDRIGSLSSGTPAYQLARSTCPRGPPWSPITRSMFCAWSRWDLTVGVKRESLGSIDGEDPYEVSTRGRASQQAAARLRSRRRARGRTAPDRR
jgi:hypothetical protein